jgi:hypothetical protein
MLQPLRKLFGLGARDWRDLARAQWALARAQWRLRRAPIGQLAIREVIRPDQVRGDPSRALELALATERVAEHGFLRPFCLVRAIALRDLLLADGIEGASIRVGVRRRNGVFEAHAWVRWGDAVLGDRPELVAQFMEVEDLGVLGRP